MSSIIRDFESGRAHILFMLTLKVSHMVQQPWRSFAVGHPDKNVALAALRETMDSDFPHPRVAALKGEPLRSQAQRWLDTGVVDGASKELQVYIVQSRLPWTVERRIEGEHSRLHRGVRGAGCHSEAFASMSLRNSFLREECERDADVMRQIIEQASRATTPWLVTKRLGLQNHPICLQTKGFLESRMNHPELVRLVYHADEYSLYQRKDMSLMPEEGDAKSAELDNPVDSADDVAEIDKSFCQIETEFAVTHLLAKVDENPDHVFSFPVDPGCFHSLSELLLARSDKDSDDWDDNAVRPCIQSDPLRDLCVPKVANSENTSSSSHSRETSAMPFA